MTTDIRYPFTNAHKAANFIVQLLQPHCERIHLAGSIRRMSKMVKDIEIVCQPKIEVLPGNELFSTQATRVISRDFTEALMTICGSIIRGHVEGRMMQIRTNSKLCPGICLDLFMPQPDDYFRIYAIRTGSADYAREVLASSWRRKGWVGTDSGLRLEKECIQKSKRWICQAENPQLPPIWESEMAFFSWLGLEYIDPEFREHKVLDETR